MAVQPASFVQYDYKKGFIAFEWANMQNGDTGIIVDCAGWLFGSVEWEGTPGVGFAAQVQASNDHVNPPPIFNPITALNVSAVGFVNSVDIYPIYARFIQPKVSAGDGTTLVTCRMLFVTQNPS